MSYRMFPEVITELFTYLISNSLLRLRLNRSSDPKHIFLDRKNQVSLTFF